MFSGRDSSRPIRTFQRDSITTVTAENAEQVARKGERQFHDHPGPPWYGKHPTTAREAGRKALLSERRLTLYSLERETRSTDFAGHLQRSVLP